MADIPGLITTRHEVEMAALVAAVEDKEALAKNIFVMAIFTAGRVMGAAQALHVASLQA